MTNKEIFVLAFFLSVLIVFSGYGVYMVPHYRKTCLIIDVIAILVVVGIIDVKQK